MSRGCQRRCRALPQLWENGSDEGGPLIDAQVTGTTAHRAVGKKNERRRRCLNLNAGEGGALTPGGGHSAPGGSGERQRLASVRGRSTGEARGGGVLERLLRVGRRENRGGDWRHSHVEEERGGLIGAALSRAGPPSR
jgi:hypothetical protein